MQVILKALLLFMAAFECRTIQYILELDMGGILYKENRTEIWKASLKTCKATTRARATEVRRKLRATHTKLF